MSDEAEKINEDIVEVDEIDKNNIKNPAIIQLIPAGYGEDRNVVPKGRRLEIPVNADWGQFQDAVKGFVEAGDGVILQVSDEIDLNKSGAGKNLSIKTNSISKIARENDVHVLSHQDNQWYLLNPQWGDRKEEVSYAPSDEEVLAKYGQFESREDWQAHQSAIWKKMGAMNGLEDGGYSGAPNHKGMLTSPGRGLEEDDLADFWSWKSNQVINPSIVGDNMIGMPGIRASVRPDIQMTPAKGPDAGKTIDIHPISLRTIGMNGYMIPMKNEMGDTPKYQVAADESVINVRLRPRAEDGISIQHNEIYDKKSKEYTFTIDGEPSHLQVKDVTRDIENNIVFEDAKGTFNASMKDDLKDTLIERGYDMPDLIDRLSVDKNAKYIWPSQGTMIGADKSVQRTVSPSNAGFEIAREPGESNKEKDYVVVVTEGALKGQIVSKYLSQTAEDGEEMTAGDMLAKDSGIIVAQVPGVSRAFIDSVQPIYEKFNVKGNYIAMDADGRDNLAVARGIKDATEILEVHAPTKVMSWDPKHKGLDDALISVHRGDITLEEMDVKFGTPEKLFPLDQAEQPNPYRLDGTRANQLGWQQEYAESSKMTKDGIKEAQKQTEKLGANVLPEKEVDASASKDQDKAKGVNQEVTNVDSLSIEQFRETQARIREAELENQRQAEYLKKIGEDLAEMLPKNDGLQL